MNEDRHRGQLRVVAYVRAWALREPFTISRGTRQQAQVVVVELHDDQGHVGRGEAGGVLYHGETQASMLAQIESVRIALESGCDRHALVSLLPAGGARHAVDAALWDLEAKRTDVRVWQKAGVQAWRPVSSAATIGIRSIDAYEAAARVLGGIEWIKIKVDHDDPVEAVAAVRRGAPSAQLLVDANQAWSVDELKAYVPALQRLGVALIEQPVAAGDDAALARWHSPIPLCADESFSTVQDLPGLSDRYAFVNIKLDKVGGLTSALQLATQARSAGLRLMVGCMLGGSVSVAPAMVLAQWCEVCDLDGPLLQRDDWEGGITYRQGVMSEPWPQLWG